VPVESTSALEDTLLLATYNLVVKKPNASQAAPQMEPVFLNEIVEKLFPHTQDEALSITQKADNRYEPEMEVQAVELLEIAGTLKLGKVSGPVSIPNRALKLALALHPEVFA